MALTTSIITGRVPLPDDASPKAAEVIFSLSGYDTEGNQVIPGGARARFVLEADGSLPSGAKLWRNTEGLRGTSYRVTVRWSEQDRYSGTMTRENDLGWVQVGDDSSYTLPDLLANPAAPAPGWYETVPREVWEGILDLEDRVEANELAISDESAARIAGDIASRDRANHTGTQPISTVSGLQAALDDKATAEQGGKADSAVQPGDLADVATSGSYDDLEGLPLLGSAAAADVSAFATATQGALAESAVQPAEMDAERDARKAVEKVLAEAGVYPISANSLGLALGYADRDNRVIWGVRPSGTVYEGGFIRSVFGENSLDVAGEAMTDADGRLIWGATRTGGAYLAGLRTEPLGENSLDLVGDVVVDTDNRVVFGVTSDGRVIGASPIAAQRRIEMIIVTGQSLAQGGANAAITVTPPYTNGAALKFVNGPVGNQPEIIGPGFVALAEEVHETVSTGMARRLLADHPDLSVLLAGQAWGGKTLAEISLGAPDGVYEKIQTQMDLAAAREEGAVIRTCVMINGEADGLISNTTFDTDLEGYRRQFALDAMTRTGQSEVPVLLTCQTSSVSGYRGGSIALRDSFTTPFLQLRAAMENPNIILIGPKYHLVYKDHSHIDAVSTRLWGEKYGQVWRHVCVEKRRWLPVCPLNVSVDNDAVGRCCRSQAVAGRPPFPAGFMPRVRSRRCRVH